jgi:outer membrane protein
MLRTILSLSLGLWAIQGNAAENYNLMQLYEQTMLTNPALKGGESTVDQFKAREDQAFSRLLPHLSANGNFGWTDFSQKYSKPRTGRYDLQYNNNRAMIQASQALFDLPSYLRYEGSGSSLKQSEQDLESIRMAITADLVDRYFEVLQTADETQYLKGEIALTESDMARIRKMFERQMAMVTDLYEVEAYYQTLLTRRIELENAHQVALEKLRETVGLNIADIAPLMREELPEVNGKIDTWVQEADHRHPAIKALFHAVEAADKEIDSNRAEHLPQLALQASDVYGNNAYNNQEVPYYNSGQMGVQANIPIYAGGAVEAAVREASAKYRVIVEKLAEKRREIDRETRTAYLNARTGHARIASTAKEMAAREKAASAQEQSYALGTTTIIALLESKKNLLKSRFEHASARYDYVRAIASLRLWSGSLGLKDIEDLNGWLARKAG